MAGPCRGGWSMAGTRRAGFQPAAASKPRIPRNPRSFLRPHSCSSGSWSGPGDALADVELVPLRADDLAAVARHHPVAARRAGRGAEEAVEPRLEDGGLVVVAAHLRQDALG